MSRALARPQIVEMVDGEFADHEPLAAPRLVSSRPEILDVAARPAFCWRESANRLARLVLLAAPFAALLAVLGALRAIGAPLPAQAVALAVLSAAGLLCAGRFIGAAEAWNPFNARQARRPAAAGL